MISALDLAKERLIDQALMAQESMQVQGDLELQRLNFAKAKREKNFSKINNPMIQTRRIKAGIIRSNALQSITGGGI